MCFFFFQAEDGIRDLVRSRGLGDVYKRQVEWAPKIKVNSIIVGYIETENSILHYGSKKEINKIAKTIPMKRMGKHENLANACLFFSSQLADWITGSALEVHGGGEKPTYLDVAKPK